MTQESRTPMTEEETGNWVREQFQRAVKHLAENGVIYESVVPEESRYLLPLLAVWKVKSNENKYYWVLSGDLPCDFMAYKTEKTAREALRHFSLNWQMQAENILNTPTADESQRQYAQLLISRAQGMYELHQKDDIWGLDSNPA